MAIYDGFFDAVMDEETGEYDLAYEAGDFTEYFGQIVGSGVCIHNNPDSMKVRMEDGAAVISPGYLFIQGYWLKNDADYTLAVSGTAPVAIAARLNLGKKMIEIEARSVAQSYPDSLVLALVNPSQGTAEDTRYNTDICGVIYSSGELSSKVIWAVNYIENEIKTKLDEAEKEILKQGDLLNTAITNVWNVVDSIVPPPIGTIKYSASNNVGTEWLKCDGRTIKKRDYPQLFELLLDVPGLGGNFTASSFYWTASTLPAGAFWTDATYGNDLFVAISTNSMNAYGAAGYSRDGIDWTRTTLPAYASWKSVAYGGGIFVAVATDRSNKAAYSYDAVTWSASTLPESNYWESVAYGNGAFVAVCRFNSAICARSTNGIAWSSASMPSADMWQGVAFGNGKFVAIAYNSNKAAYSEEGTNWTETTLPSSANWKSITFGDGKFVAIATNSNKAAYSEDGIHWTETTLPTSSSWQSVTFGMGLFVAVAGNNSAYSTNGVNWIQATMPSSAVSWTCVAYGKGIFVAASNNSTNTSSTGAYSSPFDTLALPNLSLSGIPAYIKAKEAD